MTALALAWRGAISCSQPLPSAHSAERFAGRRIRRGVVFGFVGLNLKGGGAEGVRTAILVSSTNLSIGNETRARISIQVLESAKMMSLERRHLSVIGIVRKWLVLFWPPNVNLTS